MLGCLFYPWAMHDFGVYDLVRKWLRYPRQNGFQDVRGEQWLNLGGGERMGRIAGSFMLEWAWLRDAV